MNRAISFSLLLLLILITSCNNNNSSIELRVKDAPEKEFILTRLNINQIVPVDTLKSDNTGLIKYKMEPKLKSPQFYYVLLNNKVIAPFILSPGESVRIEADTLGNFTVDGPADAVLYSEREKVFARNLTSFDSLSNLFLNSSDMERQNELNREMGKLYIKYKQDAIKYIFSNNKSIAIIPELYRKFRNEIPVFGYSADFLIFHRVYDSLKTVYPDSPYLSYLAQEIIDRDNLVKLESKLSDALEIGYPDLVLPDINNKMQRLSEMDGDVIILSFWTATNAEQRVMNADLKEIYNKYSDKGLKIYQVSLDMDKALWAGAVRDQKLPWTSVCDGVGMASHVISLYNITKLPTLFIIDRNGDIRPERDIFDDKELEKIIKKLL